MRVFSAVLAIAVSTPAFAGSIASPGAIAGPDAGPATVDPAAVFYNPAAIAASEGFHSIVDVQAASIQVHVDATRNDGIDPNTGEPYPTAEANVIVPVGLIGATMKVIPDRLAIGFVLTQPFTGGGDYLDQESDPPPYAGHQRYAGIQTKVITLQAMPAVGVTIIDGVHVGAGAGYVFDMLSALQASDPLGTEGAPIGEGEPYSMDSVLEGSAVGGHFAWNAGFFFNRFEKLQIGASYAGGGKFHAAGEGSITLPEALQNENYEGPIPALVSFDMPLPPVVRVAVASQVNEKLWVSAGYDYYYWFSVAGDADGDLVIGLTDMEGGAIDAADGSSSDVDTELYSPRRLWNAVNVSAAVGFQATPKLWIGARGGFNQFAVPDYAVSPTNLDFTSIGGMVGARYKMGPVTLGLGYTKFFPQTREITTSAWDVRDEHSEFYVDDRFSPKAPYKANTNGTYAADVNIIGVRLQVDL